MLTPERKAANKLNRLVDRFKTLCPGTVVKEVSSDWQKLVRYRAADENGIVHCVTCPQTGHWRNSDNRFDGGHFIPAHHSFCLRFHDKNCSPQCYQCNRMLSGNLIVYREYMSKTYGQELIDELEASKQIKHDFCRVEFAELKLDFLRLIKIQEKRLAGL